MLLLQLKNLTRFPCKNENYGAATGSLLPCKLLASRQKCKEESYLKDACIEQGMEQIRPGDKIDVYGDGTKEHDGLKKGREE